MAERSVVPLSGTTRRVNDVSKCIDIPKEAKNISCPLAATRITIKAPSKSILQLAKEMRPRPFEVGGQGTTTLPGISQSCAKSLTREDKVEAVSGKAHETHGAASTSRRGKVDSLPKIVQNISFNFGFI